MNRAVAKEMGWPFGRLLNFEGSGDLVCNDVARLELILFDLEECLAGQRGRAVRPFRVAGMRPT